MTKRPNTPSPNDTTSHKQQLLAHMMTGQRITPLEALDLYQCFSLAQRISDLRLADGIPVQSQFITLPNGKRIKEYWLEPSYISTHKETTA